jgi:hypothetical protein
LKKGPETNQNSKGLQELLELVLAGEAEIDIE